jgi:transcriptional regulator with XRE-family HTH domain
MPKSIIPFVGSAAKTADPAAIRTAREAAGLTQEQLADLNGVLPVEVAAWESGAISLSPHEGEMIRWAIENAAYEKQLAQSDVLPCAWLAERRAHFDAMEKRGPRRTAWVARTIDAHRAGCGACMQAERDLPAAPLPPRTPGLTGWIEHAISRLPPSLRLPARAAVTGLEFGSPLFVGMTLVDWLRDPSAGLQLSPSMFLWMTVGTAWLVLTHGLLRPLADRTPRLAGQLWSAALIFPAAFAFAQTDPDLLLRDPWLWGFAAIFSGLIGVVLGRVLDLDDALFSGETAS